MAVQLRKILQHRRRLFAFFVFVVLASLDNAAAGVLPPLYAVIARDFAARDADLGLVSALYLILVAISAAWWGYRGDRGERKPLLLYGTLLWGIAMLLTAVSPTYLFFLGGQLVTAVGVGAISSVGFSVVSDLVPAHRRGLALSLWSASQGTGAALGALMASLLGAYNWRIPFVAIAAAGFVFAVLYLFVREPERGRTEPELAPLFAAGQRYEHRIRPSQLKQILSRPSTLWLLWQSFFLSLAYGSTIWIPRWAIARVQAEGYGLEVATIVGNLFIGIFSLGGFMAIAAGHIGDRWQKRWVNGRPTLALIGLLGSIPFFIALFFIPFKNVTVPQEGTLFQIVGAVLVTLFTNGWVLSAFLVAFIGLALQATDAPNWAAMITDVNLPEHRGTVIGVSRLFRAFGNGISVWGTGWLITLLTVQYAAPLNYTIGLAAFQLLVIPAALCYLKIRQHILADLAQVQKTLTQRAGKNN